MKITISDLTELSSLKGAKVLAGRPYLGNRVTSVSVMDAATPDEAAKENGVKEGLVLTSFRAQEDKETKVKTVRRLADSGVSGLCVFGEAGDGSHEPGAAGPEAGKPVTGKAGAGKTGSAKKGAVDEEVVKEAEAKGLPLILMPGSAHGYKAVLEQVMDKLINGTDQEYDVINSTISHLLDMEKHPDFPEALEEAAIAGAFQVALFSTDFNPVLTIETRKRVTATEVAQAGRSALKPDGGISRADVKGLATYWKTVTVSGSSYFLMIADNDDNYTESEIGKLSDIIEIAAGMWKYTPSRDVRAEFIRALIRNNKELAFTLRDELDLKPTSVLSVFLIKGIPQEKMAEAASEQEKKSGIEIIMLASGEETSGICVLRKSVGEKSLPKYRNACLAFFDRLKETGKDARVFHATGLSGTEGAGEAFSLINEIWPDVMTVFPYKRVFTKYEFAMVANCVALMREGGRQKKNYTDLLEPFRREVGKAKGSQLLATLTTFVLDAGMNVGKTGKFLGVHTNTVQYRLKRIHEILGAEITGNRVVPGLTVALALTRLEAKE